jgi:Glucodextranase, domain B
MRRGVGIAALALLLGALAAGGYYIHQYGLPGATAPPPTAPVLAPVPTPEALPAPELAGDALQPQGGALATLAGFDHTVKAKRADALAWEDAEPRMPLFDNDAIRTFDKSTATIAFGRDDVVEVDQNALVVIKPRRSTGDQDEISLALLSPDLIDSLSSKPPAEQKQAIEKAAASHELHIQTLPAAAGGRDKTRVAVRSLPDKSTTVASLSGALKLIGPKGDEIVLKEKMVTRITPQGAIVTPRDLPPAPGLVSPRNGATYAYLRKSPKVEMSWNAAPRAAGYRVVVASDPSFRKVFADERVKTTGFSLRLQPGTYYWRVRSFDGDGFEGAYSEARSLQASYDDTPPKLTIVSPAEMFVSPAPSVEVRGRTEGGARVRINGQPVRVAGDGSFTQAVTLKEGVNLVTIEAADAAGNTEYGKRIITYKGSKRSNTAGISGNR